MHVIAENKNCKNVAMTWHENYFWLDDGMLT